MEEPADPQGARQENCYGRANEWEAVKLEEVVYDNDGYALVQTASGLVSEGQTHVEALVFGGRTQAGST